MFFTEPAPLEMPRASAFFIRDNGELRLEDRYNALDLWITQVVDGRWNDGKGREFLTATLAFKDPPLIDTADITRRNFVSRKDPLDLKNERALYNAIDRLSPIEPVEKFAEPRQMCRGCKEVRYYQGTNETAIVCAYLRKNDKFWRYASLTLGEGDIYTEKLADFEKKFLEGDAQTLEKSVDTIKLERALPERELLRRDARHSIAAYESWHCTDGEDYVIIDNLSGQRKFITALTNELTHLRAQFAAVVPTPVNVSNALAVVRIFSNREQYLQALEVNDVEGMEWSAAYFSPARRELVAYLPPEGTDQLMKTIRHEAFHQYLAYAAAMNSTSPWFNEGYAQYFEDGNKIDSTELSEYATLLPGLFKMDYEEFYAGTDIDRRLKYRLAHAVAYFIEKGASKVRFDPFKNLKRDYINELLKPNDMRGASAAAFGSEENLQLFVSEWKKFWENM